MDLFLCMLCMEVSYHKFLADSFTIVISCKIIQESGISQCYKCRDSVQASSNTKPVVRAQSTKLPRSSHGQKDRLQIRSFREFSGHVQYSESTTGNELTFSRVHV